MGIIADTREELRKEEIMKIFCQPTEHDITKMEKELTAIAAATPSNLGGGNHGHAGIIVEDAKYTTNDWRNCIHKPIEPGTLSKHCSKCNSRNQSERRSNS